ncbi:MAG TPA: phosphoenolpyruvate carboxykinase (ATP) [Sporosarcina psychrophila]|uniref:Phosphoenolpyruvate carboxykinase (ATP) n=1 Tax=Sporosarcina psychrophila TaxID=1476 RepID=A0A921G106_SPOPS|nr:phosphoenolpyruvate carboxykinase (ATP) [Sporosarcina psychrophila]
MELNNALKLHFNITPSQLIKIAIKRKEVQLSSGGAIVAKTGKYTGRSPKDKFIVKELASELAIDWKTNQQMTSANFDLLLKDVSNYLEEKELFVFDGFAGADQAYRLPIRIINEYAWHNLFAHQLFIRPTKEELAVHKEDFTVICVPNFEATPSIHGTNSETFIVINFDKKIVLIGGTQYAGEIKKSIFTIMNYLLPINDVLSMHCSANKGLNEDVALFFGLSGTGKTTLSADANRMLIGDDEHGWSDKGVFNIEGGCYAKCINLSEEKEPEIFRAITYGSVLENVIIDPHTHLADYNDCSLTENTRAAYPIHNIPHALNPSTAGHPNVIFFLTADAFGVLPPISKLSKEHAMYYFLSGYTSKLAGTERGITEPEATFSTCFGAPFLPLSPRVYAEMLREKIRKHDVDVYLINTGWSGGPYGIGERISLSHTRAMVTAAIEGQLAHTEFEMERSFGLNIPKSCPNVPSEILNPRNTWKDKEAYDIQATKLTNLFRENFEKFL